VYLSLSLPDIHKVLLRWQNYLSGCINSFDVDLLFYFLSHFFQRRENVLKKIEKQEPMTYKIQKKTFFAAKSQKQALPEAQ
jgi:hypothetical protein